MQQKETSSKHLCRVMLTLMRRQIIILWETQNYFYQYLHCHKIYKVLSLKKDERYSIIVF
jgi:hypothetical protein